MDLTNTLFNPNGRLSPAMFWRGYILLIAVYLVFLTIEIHGGSLLGMIAGSMMLLLVWPYLCVFGKRLHDAGKSAWWSAPIFVGIVTVGLVAKSIILLMMMGEEVMAAVDTNGALHVDPELAEMVRLKIFLPAALIDLAAGLGAGFILANLRSDRRENQYGPPTLPNGSGQD